MAHVQPDPHSSTSYLNHTFMHADSSSSLSPKLQLQLSIPIPMHDSVYYISDGNTVLLVENTLFKVHRSTLTKDKSTFDSMFSLDTDLRSNTHAHFVNVGAGLEGESDDNPIRLQGDTADEFRALLWALYALPHELAFAASANADNILLFNIARITHKYQFRSIEAWSLRALTDLYTRPVHDPLNNDTDGPSLVQLTELASLCEQHELLEAAISRWKKIIAAGKDIALAIEVAERLNLHGLLGLAYHAMMLQGRENWDADPILTRAQRIRLLSGHYNLGRLWERIGREPPPLVHHSRCTGGAQVRCHQAWSSLWQSTMDTGRQILPLQYGDVVGKVMLAESIVRALVEKEIPTQGLLDGMPWCKENALTATAAKVREIQETLADHFSDVA